MSTDDLLIGGIEEELAAELLHYARHGIEMAEIQVRRFSQASTIDFNVFRLI